MKQNVPPAPPLLATASKPKSDLNASTSSLSAAVANSLPNQGQPPAASSSSSQANDATESAKSPLEKREQMLGQGVPRFYPVIKPSKPVDPTSPRKAKTRHSDHPPVEQHVGWVMDAKEHRPARSRTTSEQEPIVGSVGSISSSPLSIPVFQHPSYSLLEENGFVQQVYTKWRARCLKGMVFVSHNCYGINQWPVNALTE